MMRWGNLHKIGLILVAVAVGVGAAGAARETPAGVAGYPAKEVNVVIGSWPGDGCDILASGLKPYLQQCLWVPFTSQYLPGSGGGRAWTYLAQNAVADGYTLAVVETPAFFTGKELLRGVAYTMDDFVPLARVVTDPAILVVAADSPLQSFLDFVTASKKAKGGLKVSHGGTEGGGYFALAQLQTAAGIRASGVSCRNEWQAWRALPEKDADACVTYLSAVLGLVRKGELRALALFAARRHPAIPKIPTLKEMKVPLAAGVSRGFCAPGGTPEEVAAVLAGVLERASASPEFRKKMEDRGYFVDFQGGREYASWLRAEDDRFRQMIRDLGGNGVLP